MSSIQETELSRIVDKAVDKAVSLTLRTVLALPEMQDDEDVRGSTQNPNNPVYHTKRTKHCNELRAKIRTAIERMK